MKGAPEISHLFFADDSIFFLKANQQNFSALKNILDDYQYISGQRINFTKSEVVFSRNVSNPVRSCFINMMEFRMVTSHSKYLGLPLLCGSNKTETFKYLIELFCKKVSG